MGSDSEAYFDRPRRDCQLGWRFLSGESRLVRIVETLEPYTVRHGSRTIEIDVALPREEGRSPETSDWLIPGPFLEKRPVAPDLEVLDGSGGIISVPTKHENQELTLAALQHMHDEGLFDLDAHPDLRDIVSDIVTMRPLVARVATLQLQERIPRTPGLGHVARSGVTSRAA